MTTIHDIVQCSCDTAFRNDVQLGWYQTDSRENIQLVKSYIFSKQSAGDRKSPIDILKMIRDAFVVRPPENRYLVIATFGHGKSHLALAAANYFGQDPKSQEVTSLLASIQKAYGGPSPEATSFRDFKTERSRHLVLCLNGTKFMDLQQAFLTEVKNSLSAALGKKNINLPFWFSEAEEFFANLGKDDIKRLNKHLEEQELDHASLLERIKAHDQSIHHACREAVRYLHRVVPNWDAHVSLASVVEWLVKAYCGPEKDFAGVLILFDEFSAFVRSYSKRSTPGSPLQDLLDGVANNRQKVVFAAFAQYDPAGWVQHMAESQSKEVLLTELDRIPRTHRFFLFNTMETILDSFLVQEEDVLKRALDQGNAWPAFSEASNRCHMLFQKRYELELRWNVELFERVVTRGCFPLHPMATALLCNIEFQEVGNARTVLGYVMEQVQRNAPNPAILDHSPNWIPARSIAEFFSAGELADEEWKQYKQALSTGGGDVTNEQQAILRSLLLWTVAKLPTRHVKQVQALSDFSAVSLDTTEKALKELADAHVISYDDATSKYSFFPPGGGNAKALEAIRQRKQGRQLSWQDVTTLNHNYGAEWGLPDLENNIPWGAGADWGSAQVLLPKEFCKADKVSSVLQATSLPGGIFWLCAKTDADLKSLQETAQAVLDEAAANPPKPIIFVLPSKPSPVLYDKLADQLIIKDFTLAQEQEFGSTVMATIKTQTKNTITDEIASLRQSPRKLLAPSPMQVALNSRPEISKVANLSPEVIKLAYPSAPPHFFDQFKRSNGRLRKSVLIVGRLLLQNAVNTEEFENDVIAPQLVTKYLVSGNPISWCVLNPSRHIQKPLTTRTAKAWDFLESKIAPGDSSFYISKALEELSRLPFGYDPNTLTLLVTAWLGFYRHDIQVSAGGELRQADIFIEHIKRAKTPEDFIAFLTGSKIAIRRKDRSKEDQAVAAILHRVAVFEQTPYTISEAEKDVAQLSNYVTDPGNADRDNTPQAKASLQDLQEALTVAKTYDQEAIRLKARADAAKSISEMLSVCKDVGTLPTTTGVEPIQPSQTDLQKDFKGRVAVAVDNHCDKYRKLTKLEDYGRNEEELTKPRTLLTAHPLLLAKIEEALDALSKQKEIIEKEHKDAVNLATLKALSPSPSLAALRRDLEVLKSLEFQLEKNTLLRGEKLAKYRSDENGLADYIRGLPERISLLKSSRAIQAAAAELTARTPAFEGTPEADTLGQLVERLHKLQAIFDQLQAVIKIPLETPEAVSSCLTNLSELITTNTDVLSPAQLESLEQARAAAQQTSTQRAAEAANWLSRLETKADSEDAWPLALKESEHSHPFLPPEQTPRLEAVRYKLTTKARQKAETEALAKADAEKLASIERLNRPGSVEELQSRLQLAESIEVSLTHSKARKAAVVDALRAAATKAAQDRDTANAKREDVTKLQALKPSTNACLQELRRTAAELEAVHLVLPESQTQRHAALQKVHAAIKDAETFSSNLKYALDSARSQREAKSVTDEINRRRFQFSEAPEQQELDACAKRAEQLENFFSTLATIIPEKVETPKHLAEEQNAVRKIVSDLEPALSNEHKALAQQTLEKLTTRAAKLRQAAEEWLAARSGPCKKENMPRLLSDLSSPPPFLPPERAPAIHTLQAALQAELDGDEVHQVISHFQKIADPQKRRDTLAQLQQLL